MNWWISFDHSQRNPDIFFFSLLPNLIRTLYVFAPLAVKYLLLPHHCPASPVYWKNPHLAYIFISLMIWCILKMPFYLRLHILPYHIVLSCLWCVNVLWGYQYSKHMSSVWGCFALINNSSLYVHINRSGCQPKSDFSAYPIRFSKCERQKKIT